MYSCHAQLDGQLYGGVEKSGSVWWCCEALDAVWHSRDEVKGGRLAGPVMGYVYGFFSYFPDLINHFCAKYQDTKMTSGK